MKKFEEFKKLAEEFINNPLQQKYGTNAFIYEYTFHKNLPITISYECKEYTKLLSKKKQYIIYIILWSICDAASMYTYHFETERQMKKFEKLLCEWIFDNFK